MTVNAHASPSVPSLPTRDGNYNMDVEEFVREYLFPAYLQGMETGGAERRSPCG